MALLMIMHRGGFSFEALKGQIKYTHPCSINGSLKTWWIEHFNLSFYLTTYAEIHVRGHRTTVSGGTLKRYLYGWESLILQWNMALLEAHSNSMPYGAISE